MIAIWLDQNIGPCFLLPETKRGHNIGLQYGHPTGRRLSLDLNFGLGCSDCYAFLWLHVLDDALASVDINYGSAFIFIRVGLAQSIPHFCCKSSALRMRKPSSYWLAALRGRKGGSFTSDTL